MKLVQYFAQLDTSSLPNSSGTNDPTASAIQTGLEVVFGVIGAVALLIIVIAGLRYIVAAGDPGQVAQAKKAIIYALVGLVIALSGFTIVAFVVKSV